MKNKISLRTIIKSAENDMYQFSVLNIMICFVLGGVPILSLLTYEFFYGSMPLNLIVIAIIGFLISAIFQGKALLDIVYNRKQNSFEYPFSLVQAFLVQAAALGLWYGVVILAFKDGNYVFDLFFQLSGHHETEEGLFFILFLGSLYLLMRLQFTNLYILEQRCSIFQAMHSSWLLTQHNNWLVERFFLWQFGVMIISIFIISSDCNSSLVIMPVVMIVLLATPMQVRMFKELEQQ